MAFKLPSSDYDSQSWCLDFSTPTAKMNCAVPSCSELECVPSFHEEFRNKTHNCEIDDEAEQIPSTQVESRYVPRNVDRREARREEKIKTLQATIKELNKTVNAHGKTIRSLQAKLDTLTEELKSTKNALDNTLVLAETYRKQSDMLSKQLRNAFTKCNAVKADFQKTEEELENERELTADLKAQLKENENDVGPKEVPKDLHTLVTKEGKNYTVAIRKLYYSLLTKQITPAHLSDIIQSVIQCFCPDVDAKAVALPKTRCAAYMRRGELKSVGMAHMAYSLSDAVSEGKSFHLNSDGTTKDQKKLNSAAINSKVFSVSEVPNGTAESIINDIDKQFEQLRNFAIKLGISNANDINWTLVRSSTSDGASTQKKFNSLIEARKKEDAIKFGAANEECLKVIENFCAMHLGVNLRKAFLDGLEGSGITQLETFIYEFAKLLGTHGVPEYGLGVVKFSDFLRIQAKMESLSSTYYQNCQAITLDRQVGNRYFVSAANAGKIFFLAEAALKFLEYTGKSDGNKLERAVYEKLQDPVMHAGLKADAIMFHHVYADLVMLAKSKELGKSVLDMGKHYLELKMFLSEVQRHPKVALNSEHRVFVSEERLYSSSAEIVKTKVNHRMHLSYQPICKSLFAKNQSNDSLLLKCLSDGCSTMATKLANYAKDQLPGGKYWEPDVDLKKVLSQLEPNNDLCESILGLNDYLSTAVPNMDQLTRSSMVQVKKNNSIEWLNSLPQVQQEEIIKLSMKTKSEVVKQYKEDQDDVAEKRQEYMIKQHQEKEMARQKVQKEREDLLKVRLLSSICEFDNAIAAINDDVNLTKAQKKSKTLGFLKEQLKYRRVVLKQHVKIAFTKDGKQRPVTTLIKEIRDLIEDNESEACNAMIHPDTPINADLFVGKCIKHRFTEDQKEQWYKGWVMSYNRVKKQHTVIYDGEDKPCHFNLMDDWEAGDLLVLSD